MIFSEKTARRVDQYIITLVRRQPSWLRKLFDEEKVVFVCDEFTGSLCLNVDAELKEDVKQNAQRLIAKYIDKHPCKALMPQEIH